MEGISGVQLISWIISLLGLLGVGVVASLFWTDLHNRKKEKLITQSKEHKLAQKLERQEEIREVLLEEIAPIKAELIAIKADLKLNNNGTLACLRTDLKNTFDDCKAKGYKTSQDAENFRDLYEAYHSLGGNSFIDHDVVPSFDLIPLKDQQ